MSASNVSLPIFIVQPTDALLHVDVMRTFMPGGGLPVAGGDEVVPVVKSLDRLFSRERRFASREAHPLGHIARVSSYVGLVPFSEITRAEVTDWSEDRLAPCARFTLCDLRRRLAEDGPLTVWPDHGEEGTPWCELHPDLDEADYAFVQVKGDDPLAHPFSALDDGFGRPSRLAEILMAQGVRRVFVDGLALDYCVKATVLDALKLGLAVVLVLDGTRPVASETGEVAIAEMVAVGAVIAMSSQIAAA